jgi:hypothetical protein
MAAEAPSLSLNHHEDNMNTENMPMPKWQKFHIMGNNCRVQQIPHKEAERIIEQWAVDQDDFDNFWTGFYYGRNDFVESVDGSPTFHY